METDDRAPGQPGDEERKGRHFGQIRARYFDVSYSFRKRRADRFKSKYWFFAVLVVLFLFLLFLTET